ncbi:unnamed protein product [Vicia faba]|uniref:Uncharacterized protein n=1 Tax=Vicia faba TaxID=3906 RepID=A0AAV0YL95_VICFA|nr:unnamed protein product [Vicia faba]
MNYFRGHFFQISRQYEMHFVMHDLLNDLAKYVCGDFCFIFDDEESHNILKMTRHFSFFNVVSLKLSNCENIVLLPPLGILPSLKNLWITGLSGIVVIGGEFYGNGSNSSSEIIPFVSLQTLSFKDMKGWEEWDCKTVPGAFSCLQKLSIQNCPNLKECLLQHLPRLMKLEISYCQHLIGGNCMEEMLLEWIGHTLSHAPLESLEITDFPTLTIPLGGCYNFLQYLGAGS